MAEKSTQSPYPLAPAANGHTRSDEESTLADHSKELKKKKRMKCLLYIILFAVFQTGIIMLFALTVMKIRNPKFRVRSGSYGSTSGVGTEASLSFNLQMNIIFGVKNTNFGHFKYGAGNVTFEYRGMQELKCKKRMKLIAYAAAFVVFQTIVILAFSLTVMRIKNPKFRVRSITVEDLTYASTPNSPSFNMRFNAELGVKNTNFGHFKFENTTISFSYGGVQVGEAFVAKGRAKARSTEKMNVTVDLNSDNIIPANSNLGNDLSSGFLTLTSQSKLSGKVHLMKLIKKKKSAQMDCTMTVNLVSRAIQDIKCK